MFKLILFVSLLLAVTGCTGGFSNIFTHNTKNFKVEIASQPNQVWYFNRLLAIEMDEGVKVSGRINTRGPFRTPRGDVELSVYNAEGELLNTVKANYASFHLTTRLRRKGGLRFSSMLRNLPSGSSIKVAYKTR